MPKYESDHDKQQRTDAAKRLKEAQDGKVHQDHKKEQDDIVKSRKESRDEAKDTPGGHTNEDTASLLDPEEQAVQDVGNKEIQDLRDQLHKDKSGVADEAKAQRKGEKEARFEQRKGEMKKVHEETNHPSPQKPATNPTNITSPATHTGVDVNMGEGEP